MYNSHAYIHIHITTKSFNRLVAIIDYAHIPKFDFKFKVDCNYPCKILQVNCNHILKAKHAWYRSDSFQNCRFSYRL